ncbi:hypothetical protein OSTOST_21936 [Ostertagia ostertagi]
MDEVKKLCGEFLVETLDPSNCLELRAFADTYACPELRSTADEYILHNFQNVVDTEEFQHLSVDELVDWFQVK